MDIIQMTKDICTELQRDERFVAYQQAKEQSDQNETLQNKINEFNLKRMELNTEIQKEEKNAALLQALDRDIRTLYAEVMEMPEMVAYNDAKSELDQIVMHMSNIISMTVNFEDPQNYDPENAAGCGGNCGSCAGCH